MKKIILIITILMMGLWSAPLFSQIEDEVVALGLPGDNLNLYAVLDVFQQSETLEEFERKLNYRDSNVNNLDLNNDNAVDYIFVVSHNLGRFHSIVLRVAINSSEYQDVAVIEVSKNNAGDVIVQIIGDEALYGENYILEPSVRSVSETRNPGYIGNRGVIINDRTRTRIYGNGIIYIHDWPIVMHLFSPSFSVYVSPWYWGYYPVYWYPWRPIFYYNYWSYHRHYYRSPRYRRASHIRVPSHHNYYRERRSTSPVVTRNRREGTYDSTYEGRRFRQPAPAPRASRDEMRRGDRDLRRPQTRPSTRQGNRESRRQGLDPSSRQRTNPSTAPAARRGGRESTRQRVPSSTAPQNRQSTRQQSRPSTRQQPPTSRPSHTRPSARPQSRPSTRQQVPRSRPPQGRTSSGVKTRGSVSQQVSRSNRQSAAASARQTHRQDRKAARQSSRESKSLIRAESQRKDR